MALFRKALDTILPFMGKHNTRVMEELLTENKALRHAYGNLAQGVDYSERTRQGTEWQQTKMAQYLGDYNPDQIPITTYDRMRWDGQLRLGLSTIKLPIMSRDFWVECESKEIKVFVYQVLKKLWRPLIKSSLTALDFGYSAHEKVWTPAENYHVKSEKEEVDYKRDMIIYKSIKDLSPATITLDYTDMMKFNGFYQNKQKQNQAFVKKDKAFVFTHDKEWGNIYGWSRLKAAYPYWYTYWILDAWHQRWLQKRGIPPVKVKYPLGQSQTATDGNSPVMEDNSVIAQRVGKSFQPDSVITLPSDVIETPTGRKGEWDIDILDDKTKIGAFVEAKEALNVNKLRAILVPERAITQDTTVGSLGISSQHVWILMESLKGLIGDFADHVNEFIIPQLVYVNFGENAPLATLHIEEIGRELTASLFEVYLNMVANGKAHPGVSKMEELLNIPAETEEEKEAREEREKLLGISGMGRGVDPGVPSQIRPQPVRKGDISKTAHDMRSRMLSERIRVNA